MNCHLRISFQNPCLCTSLRLSSSLSSYGESSCSLAKDGTVPNENAKMNAKKIIGSIILFVKQCVLIKIIDIMANSHA